MRAADILSRLSPKRAAHMIRLGDYWLAVQRVGCRNDLRPYRRNSAKATTQAATSTNIHHGGGFIVAHPIQLRAVQQRRVDSRPGVPSLSTAGAAHIWGGA
jgi:hypothetical protein